MCVLIVLFHSPSVRACVLCAAPLGPCSSSISFHVYTHVVIAVECCIDASSVFWSRVSCMCMSREAPIHSSSVVFLKSGGVIFTENSSLVFFVLRDDSAASPRS